ncbi:MAG: hypothetical protein AB8G15_08965 [Saprospiraceae bacterium]
MRNILYLILFSFFACKTPAPTKSTPINWKVELENHQSSYTINYQEIPGDSLVYQDLIRRKKSPACAKLLAYAKTDVQLLSLYNNNTDFQVHKYRSCRALKRGDSLFLSFNFSPFGASKFTYFTNKEVSIKIHQGKFDLDITHTSDASSGYIKDGRFIFKPLPKSDIRKANLSLERHHFVVGDTIKGYLKVQSTLAPQKKGSQKEILKGSFRVIVEDAEDYCKL